jgi:hypothetical protein
VPVRPLIQPGDEWSDLGRTYHGEMINVPTDLPGNELVSVGVADLAGGRESVSVLLVAMAAPRLRALGIEVRDSGEWPSHRLYELLSQSGDGAHSRYNALVGRIVSFARAAEMRPPVDASRIRELARHLGRVASRRVRIYLTGGATAVLEGWRPTTIDVDLRFEPEWDEQAVPGLEGSISSPRRGSTRVNQPLSR